MVCPVPSIQHPWPCWTYESRCVWGRSSRQSCLSLITVFSSPQAFPFPFPLLTEKSLGATFHAGVGVTQGSFISPTIFNFFVSTYLHKVWQPLCQLLCKWLHGFLFQLYIAQMAEAITINVWNIGRWADELVLTISAPKSTISLFTPQVTQTSTYTHATLNSLLPLERKPATLRLTFDPYFTNLIT